MYVNARIYIKSIILATLFGPNFHPQNLISYTHHNNTQAIYFKSWIDHVMGLTPKEMTYFRYWPISHRVVLFLKQHIKFIRILWLHISMYLCLIITIDRERSTLLVTVNTFRACVYFAATVGKLSYLVIVLMAHAMVVNFQFYFLSLDLITRWLTRDIG